MDGKGEHTHQEEVYTTPQKKGGIFNTLYPPVPPPGKKGGRIRNHCRKFWWCNCLVLIVIVLVVVLPIIYVGVPNKAQHDINASTLEVTAQDVTNPTPDSVQLKIDTVIKSDSKFHPTIDGFRAALSLKGQEPFLYVDIPQAKSEEVTKVTVNQDVKLPSLDRFSTYTKTVLASESFEVHMDGNTNLHISGLPAANVNYNKVITMKGLNKLSGLNITDIKILSGKDQILPDGSNLIGNVHVPNPSVMTLDLGNVTMDLSVDGKAIGSSLIPNLLLKPGPNVFPLQSKVDQLIVLGLVTSKYTNGILPVDIVGNSSVRNGEHLTYYEDALRSNAIKLDLNVADALAAINIKVNGTHT
jgi:hypothetical protein